MEKPDHQQSFFELSKSSKKDRDATNLSHGHVSPQLYVGHVKGLQKVFENISTKNDVMNHKATARSQQYGSHRQVKHKVIQDVPVSPGAHGPVYSKVFNPLRKDNLEERSDGVIVTVLDSSDKANTSGDSTVSHSNMDSNNKSLDTRGSAKKYIATVELVNRYPSDNVANYRRSRNPLPDLKRHPRTPTPPPYRTKNNVSLSLSSPRGWKNENVTIRSPVSTNRFQNQRNNFSPLQSQTSGNFFFSEGSVAEQNQAELKPLPTANILHDVIHVNDDTEELHNRRLQKFTNTINNEIEDDSIGNKTSELEEKQERFNDKHIAERILIEDTDYQNISTLDVLTSKGREICVEEPVTTTSMTHSKISHDIHPVISQRRKPPDYSHEGYVNKTMGIALKEKQEKSNDHNNPSASGFMGVNYTTVDSMPTSKEEGDDKVEDSHNKKEVKTKYQPRITPRSSVNYDSIRKNIIRYGETSVNAKPLDQKTKTNLKHKFEKLKNKHAEFYYESSNKNTLQPNTNTLHENQYTKIVNQDNFQTSHYEREQVFIVSGKGEHNIYLEADIIGPTDHTEENKTNVSSRSVVETNFLPLNKQVIEHYIEQPEVILQDNSGLVRNETEVKKEEDTTGEGLTMDFSYNSHEISKGEELFNQEQHEMISVTTTEKKENYLNYDEPNRVLITEDIFQNPENEIAEVIDQPFDNVKNASSLPEYGSKSEQIIMCRDLGYTDKLDQVLHMGFYLNANTVGSDVIDHGQKGGKQVENESDIAEDSTVTKTLNVIQKKPEVYINTVDMRDHKILDAAVATDESVTNATHLFASDLALNTEVKQQSKELPKVVVYSRDLVNAPVDSSVEISEQPNNNLKQDPDNMLNNLPDTHGLYQNAAQTGDTFVDYNIQDNELIIERQKNNAQQDLNVITHFVSNEKTTIVSEEDFGDFSGQNKDVIMKPVKESVAQTGEVVIDKAKQTGDISSTKEGLKGHHGTELVTEINEDKTEKNEMKLDNINEFVIQPDEQIFDKVKSIGNIYSVDYGKESVDQSGELIFNKFEQTGNISSVDYGKESIDKSSDLILYKSEQTENISLVDYGKESVDQSGELILNKSEQIGNISSLDYGKESVDQSGELIFNKSEQTGNISSADYGKESVNQSGERILYKSEQPGHISLVDYGKESIDKSGELILNKSEQIGNIFSLDYVKESLDQSGELILSKSEQTGNISSVDYVKESVDQSGELILNKTEQTENISLRKEGSTEFNGNKSLDQTDELDKAEQTGNISSATDSSPVEHSFDHHMDEARKGTWGYPDPEKNPNAFIVENSSLIMEGEKNYRRSESHQIFAEEVVEEPLGDMLMVGKVSVMQNDSLVDDNKDAVYCKQEDAFDPDMKIGNLTFNISDEVHKSVGVQIPNIFTCSDFKDSVVDQLNTHTQINEGIVSEGELQMIKDKVSEWESLAVNLPIEEGNAENVNDESPTVTLDICDRQTAFQLPKTNDNEYGIYIDNSASDVNMSDLNTIFPQVKQNSVDQMTETDQHYHLSNSEMYMYEDKMTENEINHAEEEETDSSENMEVWVSKVRQLETPEFMRHLRAPLQNRQPRCSGLSIFATLPSIKEDQSSPKSEHFDFTLPLPEVNEKKILSEVSELTVETNVADETEKSEEGEKKYSWERNTDRTTQWSSPLELMRKHSGDEVSRSDNYRAFITQNLSQRQSSIIGSLLQSEKSDKKTDTSEVKSYSRLESSFLLSSYLKPQKDKLEVPEENKTVLETATSENDTDTATSKDTSPSTTEELQQEDTIDSSTLKVDPVTDTNSMELPLNPNTPVSSPLSKDTSPSTTEELQQEVTIDSSTLKVDPVTNTNSMELPLKPNTPVSSPLSKDTLPSTTGELQQEVPIDSSTLKVDPVTNTNSMELPLKPNTPVSSPLSKDTLPSTTGELKQEVTIDSTTLKVDPVKDTNPMALPPKPNTPVSSPLKVFPDVWHHPEKSHGKLNPRPGKIILFSKPGFRGHSYKIYGDVGNACEWELQGTISVQIIRGGWLLYEKPYFRGRRVMLGEGDTDLTCPWDVQDKSLGNQKVDAINPTSWIGSLRHVVRDFQVPRISLFVEENGEGNKITILGATSDSCANGQPNKTESIIVHSGLWLVYNKPFFEGDPYILEPGGYPNRIAWNGHDSHLSSLQPARIGGPTVEKPNDPKILLFQHPEFKGHSWELTRDLHSLQGELNQLGERLTGVGSLKVLGGCWAAYEKEGFHGHQFLLEEGDYKNWSKWGGCTEELGSLRHIHTDFSEPEIILYENPGCLEGSCLRLNEALADIEVAQYGTNTGSIQVLNGVWVAYENVDFSGEQYILEKGSYHSYHDWGAKDGQICSVQPVAQVGGQSLQYLPKIQLFSEPNFHGDYLTYTEDRILLPNTFSPQSCRIEGGSWILYEGDNCCGEQYILVEGDYPTRTAMGCQAISIIQSLKKVPLYFCIPSISLHGLEKFEGKELEFTEAVRSLQGEGYNNHVLSVKVARGIWVLYEHSDFRGRQWLLERTQITNWLLYSGIQRIGSLCPVRQRKVYFRLRNRALGLFLCVPEPAEDMKAARVQVTEPREGSCDLWYYEQGRIKNQMTPQMSLQIVGMTAPGTKVVMWSEGRKPIQTWSIEDSGLLMSCLFEGLCLDIKGGHSYDSDHVVVWEPSEDRLTQQWDLEVF